jgi:hypothetical protein
MLEKEPLGNEHRRSAQAKNVKTSKCSSFDFEDLASHSTLTAQVAWNKELDHR